MRFSGKVNLDFRHVRQIVPVEPGAAYRLRFVRKSQGITTDQGVFLEVAGYGCGVFVWRLENGKSVRSLRSKYEAEFAQTKDIAFRISVDRWVVGKEDVTLHGRFDLNTRFHDRTGVHSQGTVTLGLQPDGDGFRVTSVDYAFVKAEAW